MNWQLILTWSAVAVAAFYVLWCGRLALRASKGSCSGGCGCAKTTSNSDAKAIIAPEELKLRQRPERTK